MYAGGFLMRTCLPYQSLRHILTMTTIPLLCTAVHLTEEDAPDGKCLSSRQNQVNFTSNGSLNGACRIKGLVMASHTHCRQVSLPFIGPLGVPNQVPSFAHSDLYEGGNVTVCVTSGVGASILPLRIGTRSQWDFTILEVKQ